MPSIVTRPDSASSSRGNSFISVDLPLPFGPTSAMHSPGWTYERHFVQRRRRIRVITERDPLETDVTSRDRRCESALD